MSVSPTNLKIEREKKWGSRTKRTAGKGHKWGCLVRAGKHRCGDARKLGSLVSQRSKKNPRGISL